MSIKKIIITGFFLLLVLSAIVVAGEENPKLGDCYEGNDMLLVTVRENPIDSNDIIIFVSMGESQGFFTVNKEKFAQTKMGEKGMRRMDEVSCNAIREQANEMFNYFNSVDEE